MLKSWPGGYPPGRSDLAKKSYQTSPEPLNIYQRLNWQAEYAALDFDEEIAVAPAS